MSLKEGGTSRAESLEEVRVTDTQDLLLQLGDGEKPPEEQPRRAGDPTGPRSLSPPLLYTFDRDPLNSPSERRREFRLREQENRPDDERGKLGNINGGLGGLHDYPQSSSEKERREREWRRSVYGCSGEQEPRKLSFLEVGCPGNSASVKTRPDVGYVPDMFTPFGPYQTPRPTTLKERLQNCTYALSPEDIATLEKQLDKKDKPKGGKSAGAPPSSKHAAKLNPYDGISEPLETFLVRFEKFSVHFKWSDEERLFHLSNSLGKTVGNVLWDSGTAKTAEDLIKLLKGRYGTENQSERFRMELKYRRRKKGETLQEVFYDVKRLMALAFPRESGPMAEAMAIDYFVETFGDRSLKIKVLEKSPSTLDEALNWAVRFEAIERSVGLDGAAVYDHDGRAKEKGFVRALEASGAAIPPSVAREMEELRSEVQRWRALGNSPTSVTHPGQGGGQPPTYSQGQGPSTGQYSNQGPGRQRNSGGGKGHGGPNHNGYGSGYSPGGSPGTGTGRPID